MKKIIASIFISVLIFVSCEELEKSGFLEKIKLRTTYFEENINLQDPNILDSDLIYMSANNPSNKSGRAGVGLTSSQFLPPYVWVANHSHNTVSKFDIETNMEDGRYYAGENPSRTAVDIDGNAWIGGRNDGRLTKILWNRDECVGDANNNGEIDPVSNGDAGDLGPKNSSADPYNDECVVYSEITHSSIRGLAGDAKGRMWIGYTYKNAIQYIDIHTFEKGPLFDTKKIPEFKPDKNGVYYNTGKNVKIQGVYGLVINSDGILYFSPCCSYKDRSYLVAFNTNTEEWIGAFKKDNACSYGIAVDKKDRVWWGGWPECEGVGMFDPDTMKIYTFGLPDEVQKVHGNRYKVDLIENSGAGKHPNGSWKVTGVGVEPATGDVWASFYPTGFTGRLQIDEDKFEESTWKLIGTNPNMAGWGYDLRGIGFDYNGYAWTMGVGSSKIFKIDPNTNNHATDLPVGKVVGTSTHYTYSDFTGSTAVLITSAGGKVKTFLNLPEIDFRPFRIGLEATIFDGSKIEFRVVEYDASLGRDVGNWAPIDRAYYEYPMGDNSFEVEVDDFNRVFNDKSEYYLEVKFTKSYALGPSPILHSIYVEWRE